MLHSCDTSPTVGSWHWRVLHENNYEEILEKAENRGCRIPERKEAWARKQKEDPEGKRNVASVKPCPRGTFLQRCGTSSECWLSTFLTDSCSELPGLRRVAFWVIGSFESWELVQPITSLFVFHNFHLGLLDMFFLILKPMVPDHDSAGAKWPDLWIHSSWCLFLVPRFASYVCCFGPLLSIHAHFPGPLLTDSVVLGTAAAPVCPELLPCSSVSL